MAERAAERSPITPIAFTQHLVVTVDAWPERTSFMPDALTSPHLYHAAYDARARTLTFAIFNGAAVYRLTGEALPHGALVAERVEHATTDRTA